MTRNRVLNICVWAAALAHMGLYATEKLSDFEVPFSDEWKLATSVFIALCLLFQWQEHEE